MTNLECALIYHKTYKLCVVPANGKVPLVEWKRYQDIRPTEEEVRNFWTQYPDANIAIVTGPISGGLAVIDIDTEDGLKLMDNLIPEGLSYPFATTPKGQHWYFKTNKKIGDGIRKLPGVDFRNQGLIIAPPSVNGTGKYEWVVALKDVSPPELPIAIYEAFNKAINISNTIIYNKILANDVPESEILEKGRRDNDLFTVALALRKHGQNDSFIRKVLTKLSLDWDDKKPGLVEIQIKNVSNRVENHHENLSQEVRNWVESTSGDFLSTDIDKDLGLSTKVDKGNRSKILRRMVDEGVIEKTGKRNGVFRRIDKDITIINWEKSDAVKTYDIKFPFGEENLVNIYSKNIIMLAGASNAGKTGYLLNLVKLNMMHKDVTYFSSEMGAEEMKIRLEKFKDVDKWKFRAVERASNFSDVIQPDGFNIIDFLEISDNFFAIGEDIRKIYDKLRKGIAVIAIQKKSNTDNVKYVLGRGAEFSMEKSRLYMTLDNNSLKIVKAKNWKYHDINPNGAEVTFKLVGGCKFVNISKFNQAGHPIDF